MRKPLITMISVLSVMGAAAQFPGMQIELPPNATRNIDYVGDGIEAHQLDIFLPDSVGGPYKPIIVIYGSAWFANNAKDMGTASLGRPLLDGGFAVVSINHRSSTDAQWPAQINDVKAAIRYIRANAERYNLDPSFIGITGFSSGGHLSSMAGVTNRVKNWTAGDITLDIEGSLGDYTSTSSEVDAVVDWFGPVDMFHMSDDCSTFKDGMAPEAVLIGGNPADNVDMVALISTPTYVDSSDPMFMVIHGNADNVVPYCQSVNFSELLDKHGKLQEFITVDGGGHGPVTFNEDTFAKMVEFFKQEAAKPKTYVTTGNPLFPNRFTADPAPLVYDGRLYLYAGHDEYYDGQDGASGGKEFNITEWVCYSTDDMVNWTDHGAVLSPADFKWAKEAAWAAQVVEKDGKFYYYTTSIGNDDYPGYCVGVAVADSPIGPFVDAKGAPLVTDNMTDNGQRGWWNDIDPTVLIDGDDAYLCWGNGTCFLAKLKPNMIEIDGDIQVVSLPNYVEGPWLSKRGDLYYLTYAGIGEKFAENIQYATAPSINGPWTPQGVVVDEAENSFTIHPGIADFNGKSYMFYHNAAQTIDGHPGAIGRRSVCVDELHYNPDGTMQKVVQTKK